MRKLVHCFFRAPRVSQNQWRHTDQIKLMQLPSHSMLQPWFPPFPDFLQHTSTLLVYKTATTLLTLVYCTSCPEQSSTESFRSNKCNGTYTFTSHKLLAIAFCSNFSNGFSQGTKMYTYANNRLKVIVLPKE